MGKLAVSCVVFVTVAGNPPVCDECVCNWAAGRRRAHRTSPPHTPAPRIQKALLEDENSR